MQLYLMAHMDVYLSAAGPVEYYYQRKEGKLRPNTFAKDFLVLFWTSKKYVLGKFNCGPTYSRLVHMS